MHFVRIVETLNEPLLTLMKKYLLWICTAAALLAAGASCSDDPEVDSVGRVGIQQESLTADGAGEDLTLNVTSNAYWRINFTDPETGESVRWVTASETSGMGNTAVTLKVARNRSTSARSTYVNVITESESSAVSVLLSQSAGTIGGGGLGKIAINYGYYRYKTLVMILAVILLIVMVHIFQSLGTYLSKKSDRRIS